tara:strand:- start:547 stop:705 length:159 start_codon:yes stop_codon:yes gene_type:complete
MKIGDLVRLTYTGLLGIIVSAEDEHGWYKVLDFNGTEWECNGMTLVVINEGG